MKSFTLVLCIPVLASCTLNPSNLFRVEVGDNASVCVTTRASGLFVSATAKRVQIPAEFDVSTLTVEELREVEQILCRPQSRE